MTYLKETYKDYGWIYLITDDCLQMVHTFGSALHTGNWSYDDIICERFGPLFDSTNHQWEILTEEELFLELI